jgi:hypothetical protein
VPYCFVSMRIGFFRPFDSLFQIAPPLSLRTLTRCVRVCVCVGCPLQRRCASIAVSSARLIDASTCARIVLALAWCAHPPTTHLAICPLYSLMQVASFTVSDSLATLQLAQFAHVNAVYAFLQSDVCRCFTRVHSPAVQPQKCCSCIR